MSFVFFAHAALFGSSCSSRTNMYAADTQNLTPCLDKNYSLIMKINMKKTVRLILEEITRSNLCAINLRF
jgi:hypothetical protein